MQQIAKTKSIAKAPLVLRRGRGTAGTVSAADTPTKPRACSTGFGIPTKAEAKVEAQAKAKSKAEDKAEAKA